MKITISGTPGSGKSYIARQLCEKLNYHCYDVGHMRRKVAEDHGLTLEELNKIGEKEKWTDEEVDLKTTEIGKKEDNFIFVARIGYHFIPDSYKIFLECDLEVGAKRILGDDHVSRGVESYQSVNDAVKKLKSRMASDTKRYQKYYGLDYLDRKNYDLVVDTSNMTQEQVLEKILQEIKANQ